MGFGVEDRYDEGLDYSRLMFWHSGRDGEKVCASWETLCTRCDDTIGYSKCHRDYPIDYGTILSGKGSKTD